MASSPVSSAELIDLVRKSGLAADRLDGWLRQNPALPNQVKKTAAKLVADGVLTPFHAKHMLAGKYKGFLLGQYKVLDEIGRGGMGAIFLAEHVTMKRQVAIKVLPADKASDEESRERFYREARIVAALDHPNVVHAYDVDKSGDTLFMVMEYIEGESLEQLLRRNGPLPTKEAADYVAQAARGLQHAHERGLVHRDIKPANIVLDHTGVVKVLDLGLARFFEESSSLTAEHCSGSVIGTADFMAPEQAVNSHEVDIRADIYSLGVTLYALLAGQPPYASATVAQKLLAHHMREPEPLQSVRPDVPDELADIVMKMLAKQPRDRYQTPGEVAEALTEWIKSSDLSSALTAKTDKTIIQRYPRLTPAESKKRGTILAIIAGVALILVAGIIIGVAASGGKKPDNTSVKHSDPTPPVHDSKTTPVTVAKVAPKEPKIGELRLFDTKNEQIERLALSPYEQLLAGAGMDGRIKIWDFDSGALREDIKAHNGPVRFVDFATSGLLLLSAGQDGSIKIWNTDTWKEERKLGQPNAPAVKSAVFSPDEKLIFAGGDDGLGRIWSAQTGDLVRSCSKRHEKTSDKPNEKPQWKTINWVAWSPDGKLVYTAGQDGTLRGWNAATGEEKFVFKQEKEKSFNVVLVTRDSASLVVAGDSSNIYVLNARTGQKIRNFIVDNMGAPWAGMLSKNGALVVMTGHERAVRVWDLETGTPYQTFGGLNENLPGCVINADGRRVAASMQDKTLRLWGLPPR